MAVSRSSALSCAAGLGLLLFLIARGGFSHSLSLPAFEANTDVQLTSRFARPAAPDATTEESVRDRIIGLNLQRLIDAGAIRPATKADLAPWMARYRARLRRDQSYSIRPLPEMSYVVLRPFQIPADLRFDKSRTFVLPPGMPLPTGPIDDNLILFPATGECLGGCEPQVTILSASGP